MTRRWKGARHASHAGWVIPIGWVFVLGLLATPGPILAQASSAADISAEAAARALDGAMRSRGLAPADGLANADYVTTSVQPANRAGAGTRHVGVWLDDEGRVLPGRAALDAAERAGTCRARGRYVRSPAKRLNFKVNRLTDGHVAFVQVIDVETGRVEAQREGSADPGGTGLQRAMQDAWRQLRTPIGPMVGPCGDEITDEDDSLLLALSSEIRQKQDGARYAVSRVRAEIPLRPAAGGYEGTGTARIDRYTNTVLEQAGCTTERSDGAFHASLVLEWTEEPRSEDAPRQAPHVVLTLTPEEDRVPRTDARCTGFLAAVGSNLATVWWPAFVAIHEPDIENGAFRFAGWRESNRPDVLAEKRIEREVGLEDGTIIENTVFELHGRRPRD